MNYSSYLQSEHWEKARKYVLDSNSVCEFCGNKYNLNVHHKTYANIGDEEVDDLIVLCKRCHGLIHTTNNINTDKLIFMPKGVLRKLGNLSQNEIILFLSIYNGISLERQLDLSQLKYMSHIRAIRRKSHLSSLASKVNMFEFEYIKNSVVKLKFKKEYTFKEFKSNFIILDIDNVLAMDNKYDIFLYIYATSILRGDKGLIGLNYETYKETFGLENVINENSFVHRFIYEPVKRINKHKQSDIEIEEFKRHGTMMLSVRRKKMPLKKS